MDPRTLRRVLTLAGVAIPVAIILVLSAGFSWSQFVRNPPKTALGVACLLLPPLLVSFLGATALYWKTRYGDDDSRDQSLDQNSKWMVTKGMGALAFSIGIALVAINVVTVYRCSVSSTWPTAQGRVLSSRLLTMAPGSTRQSRWPTYAPEATVLYRVAERSYQTTNIRFGLLSKGGSSGEQEAEERLKRYPAGGHVLVYFNPGKPEQSVLEPGLGADSFFSLLLGVVFLFGGRFLWKFASGRS